MTDKRGWPITLQHFDVGDQVQGTLDDGTPVVGTVTADGHVRGRAIITFREAVERLDLVLFYAMPPIVIVFDEGEEGE